MNETAGKGHPYWYEWTVGLVKVVEMLRPEAGISSVTFQATGEKGWDDVVVAYADGHSHFLQVKHSRVGRNITFGDLVSSGSEGPSLLSELFLAWRGGNRRPGDRYILFTNRAAGTSVGRSVSGITRPSLAEFMASLKLALKTAFSLDQCRPSGRWTDAWDEWQTRLDSGTPAEALAFLRSLELETNQEDLERLESTLLDAVAETFQVPRNRATPLLQALDSALRRWTTDHECVTAEDAFSAMALDEESDLEHRAPPPPVPFFPSRRRVIADVEATLSARGGSSVVFLTAAPGAGKTSIVSELATRRCDDSLDGLVGLRYFAFRPITPNSPLIAPDADDFVRPDRLWFSLLSQLRRGLHGKLRAYGVPLRNGLLSWLEARSHVLRIGTQLGSEMQRPFVVVVDGIDHAARAMRNCDPHAKQFFESLPTPDELAGKPLRLMVAGQLPEFYSEYPTWLRTSHPKVQRINMAGLEREDVATLLRSVTGRFQGVQEAAAVHTIELASQGNTLAVVFAVEEARTCNTLDELRERLANRHLRDGLHAYYNSIWQYGLPHASAGLGIGTSLATALCLSAEALSGRLLSSVLHPTGWSPERWESVLASLGPLVVADTDSRTFRVLHNDVRIFLQGYLSGHSEIERRQPVSLLADHYLTPECNRVAAHRCLRRLLVESNRAPEWARVFTVEWVFEAAALGMNLEATSNDCAFALEQGFALRDWDAMHALACATETLGRWEESFDHDDEPWRPRVTETPEFLHTEVFVRPASDWTASDLKELVLDAERLLEAGQPSRAEGLLTRWLKGLSISALSEKCRGLYDIERVGRENKPQLGVGADKTLQLLGRLCRTVGLNMKLSQARGPRHWQAEVYFEEGWVRASCSLGPFDDARACFGERSLRYFNSFGIALRLLADRSEWTLIRALLRHLSDSREQLSADLRAHAAWWALRSGTAEDDVGWIDVLSRADFGIETCVDLAPAISVCRARGWKEPATEPGVIAEQVAAKVRGARSRGAAISMLGRLAATLGRVEFVFQNRGAEAAATFLPAAEVRQLAEALWSEPLATVGSPERYDIASELGLALVRAVIPLGGTHLQALVSAGESATEKCVLDYRQDSLWELYRRTGDSARLRKWLDKWLSDDSSLWSDGSRECIGHSLIPLARELGESAMADRAEERLRWSQITYRSHKEDALGVPVAWLKELVEIEPTCWRNEGLKLWEISEACSQTGGDDGYSFELGKVLGSATYASSPADLWRLFAAEYRDCGTDSWFHPTANRVIDGFIEFVQRTPTWASHDKLSCWCLAVGMSRWFSDSDIERLANLRDVLNRSLPDEQSRAGMREAIKTLTPGEARREPRAEGRGSPPGAAASRKGVQDWLRQHAAGRQLRPSEAAGVLEHLAAVRPRDLQELRSSVLRSIGNDTPFASHWLWYDLNLTPALKKIVHLVPDDLLWDLIHAALRYSGSGKGWAQGVHRNIQYVILARSSSRGTSELRSGLVRLMDMHKKWLRGARNDSDLPKISLASAEAIPSWAEACARILGFLLASRSPQVVASALVGIHALVHHEPRCIRTFLQIAQNDEWKKYWILNAAEVWATCFPEEFSREISSMQEVLTGRLRFRLQSWVNLVCLADRLDTARPTFPNPPEVPFEESRLIRPAREILSTPGDKRGSLHFVDRFGAADSLIQRLEYATGADFRQLRSNVSTSLTQAVREDFDSLPWPARICCYRDTRMSNMQAEEVLDGELDKVLQSRALPERLQAPFTQVFLSSEDPWTLRHTPMPGMESLWPSDSELSNAENKGDFTSIRGRLASLAVSHGVPDGETVVAARVQVFTNHRDVILRFWYDNGIEALRPTRYPSTLNGRTFVFHFDSWWEPQDEDYRCVAYACGGLSRLMLASPDFLPSCIWASEFGWHHLPTNPHIWLSEKGQPVARFERLHGSPRSAMRCERQPYLGRWLAKTSVWEDIAAAYGFRMHDDLEVFDTDTES